LLAEGLAGVKRSYTRSFPDAWGKPAPAVPAIKEIRGKPEDRNAAEAAKGIPT